MQILINTTGTVRTIYSELVDMRPLGKLAITRGSHVEPTEDGLWTADMSPVAGPVLGPFANRSGALAAELAWLEEHWLTKEPVR